MNLKLVGIGIVLLLVVGGLAYFVMQAVNPTDSMTVQFYDANDELVATQSTDLFDFDFAFMSGGVEVTKIVVIVDYDTTITSEEEVMNINIDCDLTWTVYLNTRAVSIVNGPETVSDSKTTASGTFEWTFYLDELIPNPTAIEKENGWGIVFEATLSGTAYVGGTTHAGGTLITATDWTGIVSSSITWDEIANTMEFEGPYIGRIPS